MATVRNAAKIEGITPTSDSRVVTYFPYSSDSIAKNQQSPQTSTIVLVFTGGTILF